MKEYINTKISSLEYSIKKWDGICEMSLAQMEGELTAYKNMRYVLEKLRGV